MQIVSRSMRRRKKREAENRLLLLVGSLAAFVIVCISTVFCIVLSQVWANPVGKGGPEVLQAATPSWIADVEASDAVAMDFFDDALFIGDSLTSGLDIYNIIPNAEYIWAVGVNPQTACTDRVFTNRRGDAVALAEALAERDEPAKIYVMMGLNGIKWMPPEAMFSHYGRLLDLIRSAFPAARIYVQSLTPTAYWITDSIPGLARDNILVFNEVLKELAAEERLLYLDVFSALADEDGYLPDRVASSDGYHFTPEHYQLWLEYLRTHT